MIDARLLTLVLTDPQRARALDTASWTALLTIARAERLDATLAWRLDGIELPEAVAHWLAAARANAETGRTAALWEAEMTRRALADCAVPIVLLKGTAFVIAGLDAGRGRLIGDTDILVPRAALGEVEAALRVAGWEWVDDNPYDQSYYRDHMHELPPLIHRSRDRMIDVHHTILPLSSRIRPDANALIADSEPLANGLRILCREDMIIHAVAHLFADGDLAGGLRNLWDIDRLVRESHDRPEFWEKLRARAMLHQLPGSTARALRLAHHLFATPVDALAAGEPRRGDVFFLGRLLARNRWGQPSRPLLRFAFYVRSHWIRMPPLRLARHLFTKWRKSGTPRSSG